MRKTLNINESWEFIKKDISPEQAAAASGEKLDLPFTWNGTDGQDGGNDYVRGAFWFVKKFSKPEFCDDEEVYVEFKGVNSSAEVYLNGALITEHHGGYSTFRANVTSRLKPENLLLVRVDNSKTEKVYPQTADFTFYGGIYRDVNLIIANKNRFDLDFFGSSGLKITPTLAGADGEVIAEAYVTGSGEVKITVYDADGNVVAAGAGGKKLTVKGARLWDGIRDPYLYTLKAELFSGGKTVDCVIQRFGFRTYSFDPKNGFVLNGKPYPLRGVCRHQDRPEKGNALTKADHDEDMRLIKEIGANTVRLAHYQQDDYFYDLCDENGLVVWAEIPYISRHMPEANENALSQMKELIYQQFNHASIVMWGISNEITMHRKHKKDMLAFHKRLNAFVKSNDPERYTTLACFAMCGFNNRSAFITDLVAWNLYLGWYVPGFFLNDLWIRFFRFLHPKRCLGYSEYGAEAMPNLHSKRPKRGDNSEEYQAKYHEYMLKCFERYPYLWGTYVWNMFDFAADARNQGGEPGMNHKGLVTFDRKIKKDAFYIYKAYWSKEPFVHIAGKRFENRTGRHAEIKVYSNAPDVTLYIDGKPFKTVKGDKIFKFKVPLKGEIHVKAVSGEVKDEFTLRRVDKPDPAYKLHVKSETQSWQK